jgi:porphobilinogen synthase
MRRLRKNSQIRSLVRENSLTVSDFVYPIFIKEGNDIKSEIPSMPGICQYSLDRLDEELERVIEQKIGAVLLFGIPEHKDECGSSGYDKDGIVQKGIRHIKEKYPDLVVIADVCLCEYTSHGHCGIIKDNEVLNDETLTLLAKMALSMAEAGADIIAPSDMMDNRVSVIRKTLEENGYKDIIIMSYSAKFASAYYSPFREAAHSAPSFGDRKTYQMDKANANEALRECLLDIEEGADIIMVKPALAYLDIIKTVSEETKFPLAAYNVSGEYSMVKAAAKLGYIDEKKVVLENLMAIKRAGAKIIITYHAIDAARWILEGGSND